jgi:cytidine deaminase
LKKKDLEELVARAREAREHAYAPYSRFRVGAAVRSASGTVYVGCNVENASFGATICAERNAIAQMIAAGEREVVACAVISTGDVGASPCGICRQVLAEFSEDCELVLVGIAGKGKGKEHRRTSTLAKLLPDSFRSFQGE